MAKTLREYYPSIRTRQEILNDITSNPELNTTFRGWEEKHQERFLNFCSGAKGVKMLYDGFFKELFNPDAKPQRLEELLSLLLNDQIKILHVLPNESNRIADENSLLIMDIVVQLSNGSIANVECQKIGYLLPGQRAACYSADLLLRQFKRVRDEKKEKFSYQDIKKVYSIIFYETSPHFFKKYPSDVLHYFKQTSNTGLEMDLLQEYCFVPLDIANQIYQNKVEASSKLEAWLVFLSNDDPEVISKLITRYPEFESMYHEIFELCKDTKQVMNMFSEELKILDRNTVQLMIDEMQAEIAQKDDVIAQRDDMIAQKDDMLAQKDDMLAQKDDMLAQKDDILAQKDDMLAQKDDEILRLKKLLAEAQK